MHTVWTKIETVDSMMHKWRWVLLASIFAKEFTSLVIKALSTPCIIVALCCLPMVYFNVHIKTHILCTIFLPLSSFLVSETFMRRPFNSTLLILLYYIYFLFKKIKHGLKFFCFLWLYLIELSILNPSYRTITLTKFLIKYEKLPSKETEIGA